MSPAEYLESPLLRAAGFRHAFFTRRGGVSAGPYASLNFSSTVGDADDRVAENLARAATALGVAPTRLYFLTQVHGDHCQVLRGDEIADQVRQQTGDAVVSASADLACCVRVADCVPVLLADPLSGTAAAVHAGWRGVVADVVSAAVELLGQVAGCAAQPLAAIGPHISLPAFEVSEEVAAALQGASSATRVVDRARGERPHVDLRTIVRAQLRDAGLGDAAIDDVTGCTVSEPERFFSYRRDGAHSGRHLAGIVPRREPPATPPAGPPSLVV